MLSLQKELFFRVNDASAAKQLFKTSVDRIIIETSSYCNRQCPYCPNSLVDRLKSKNYMSESLLDKITQNLVEIDFCGTIVLHFYNEPLADENICTHISRFSKSCPKATIELYSNGDYLNAEYLTRLQTAGLQSLRLSLHLGNKASWDDTEILRRLDDLSKRINIPATMEIFSPGKCIQAKFPYPGMNIVLNHLNFPVFGGSDRAGSIETVKTEDKPLKDGYICVMPFTQFYVAWDGSVVPCCDIHPDVPSHQKYKAGNMRDFPDIFSAFANSSIVDWRRALADLNCHMPPCSTCNWKVCDPRNSKIFSDFFVSCGQ